MATIAMMNLIEAVAVAIMVTTIIIATERVIVVEEDMHAPDLKMVPMTVLAMIDENEVIATVAVAVAVMMDMEV